MKSLRARLLIAGSLILASFCFLTVLALDRAFRTSALEAQEEKMKGLVYSLLGSIDLKKDGTLVFEELTVQDNRLLTPHSGLVASITEENGKVIWRSPSIVSASALPASQMETGQWSFTGEDSFLLGFGATWVGDEGKNHKFTVYVGEDRGIFLKHLETYHRTLWRWLLFAVVLLLIALALVLRWSLLPLRTVAQELKEIQDGKKEGIERSYPRELTPLTDGLNSLLRHERGQQKRYRNALDDLAHSLKTPLAAIRGFGDARMSDQIEQIDKILDYQVRRASTAGRSVFSQPIQISTLAEKLMSALTKVYREKGVSFQSTIPTSIKISMDEGDLMEVMGNLLDNAAKWCKHKVVLSAELQSTTFRLIVEDDGPGFPKEKREDLLERGVRADRRVPGEGIGLAVVHQIAVLYEGSLSLENSPLGGAKVVFMFCPYFE